MRYHKIPNSLFKENRIRFVSKMLPNTIAILTSNDVKHNNADDVMGFTQNNDLFYLSGIDQEDTLLVLYPDAIKEENKVTLFVIKSSISLASIGIVSVKLILPLLVIIDSTP